MKVEAAPSLLFSFEPRSAEPGAMKERNRDPLLSFGRSGRNAGRRPPLPPLLEAVYDDGRRKEE